VHGVAHITGGGLHENLARIMPAGSRAIIDRGSWNVPPVFGWIQRLGEIEADEMDRVFNMGLGLVLVVSSYYADSVRHQLDDCGLANWPIGEVIAGESGVAWA
jgi:phosphoribosylformylglycinamidine cyclo-ligase